MKENNIETAREFLNRPENQYHNAYEIMRDYAASLQPAQSGKTAEEILREIMDGRFLIGFNDALKAMHEFASQPMPVVTDEEIKKEARTYNSQLVSQGWNENNANAFTACFIEGMELMRSKLTGK